MQEAFIKLFNHADPLLYIIPGISFLLGLLVWALLAHLPAYRKNKKVLQSLEAGISNISKEKKALSERLTVTTARMNRSTEEMETAEANLKEKQEIAEEQKTKITIISNQLELYKDHARNFKESKEKLMEEYQSQATLNSNLKAKAEGLKSIVEDVEEEKSTLELEKQKAIDALNDITKEKQKAIDALNDITKEKQKAIDALNTAQKTLKSTSKDLKSANGNANILKRELKDALKDNSELKKSVIELEGCKKTSDTEDLELNNQINSLQKHIQELELESGDLINRLQPFLKEEVVEQKKNEEMDVLIVDLLDDAEKNMGEDGFLSNINETDLIEDKNYLEKTLCEEEEEELQEEDIETEEIVLTTEEAMEMDEASNKVSLAMELQGFYTNIEKSVLVEPQDDNILSDDELIEKNLDDTASLLETSLFYREAASEDGFVENKKVLTTELQKIKTIGHQRGEEGSIALDDKDHKDMDTALASVSTAMNNEGLYMPVDNQKLTNTEETSNETTNNNNSNEDEFTHVKEDESIPMALSNDQDNLNEID